MIVSFLCCFRCSFAQIQFANSYWYLQKFQKLDQLSICSSIVVSLSWLFVYLQYNCFFCKSAYSYIYIYTCMYIYTYICLYIYLFLYLYSCIFVHVSLCDLTLFAEEKTSVVWSKRCQENGCCPSCTGSFIIILSCNMFMQAIIIRHLIENQKTSSIYIKTSGTQVETVQVHALPQWSNWLLI